MPVNDRLSWVDHVGREEYAAKVEAEEEEKKKERQAAKAALIGKPATVIPRIIDQRVEPTFAELMARRGK
jgi:hypothetical protein